MNELDQKEVFDSLKRITNTITSSPLIQKLSELVGIEFAVVGGAVRDIYLDKPIKDIDISISLNFYKNLNINYPTSKNDSLDEIAADQSAEADALSKRDEEIFSLFGSPEYSIIHDLLLDKEKKPTAIQSVVTLIHRILEKDKNYSIDKVYDDNFETEPSDKKPNLKDMAYRNIGLSAVIALSDKNTNYPIEILFTTHTTPVFIGTFDFDICKVYMVNKENEPFIITTPQFLNDVENKTINYTPCANITEAKINKSLMVRYERLQKKFSEYLLTSDTSGVYDKKMKDLVDNTVKAVSLYHQIKENSKNTEPKKIIKSTSKI